VIGAVRATTDSLANDEAAFKEFFGRITPRHPELR
jgi:hypothetical protein